jgi:hypothetical protein
MPRGGDPSRDGARRRPPLRLALVLPPHPAASRRTGVGALPPAVLRVLDLRHAQRLAPRAPPAPRRVPPAQPLPAAPRRRGGRRRAGGARGRRAAGPRVAGVPERRRPGRRLRGGPGGAVRARRGAARGRRAAQGRRALGLVRHAQRRGLPAPHAGWLAIACPAFVFSISFFLPIPYMFYRWYQTACYYLVWLPAKIFLKLDRIE